MQLKKKPLHSRVVHPPGVVDLGVLIDYVLKNRGNILF
jgi:hypothetical protein